MIGIPYASHKKIGRKWYAVCPICKENVELHDRKDSESFSGKEYQRHYATKHDEAGRKKFVYLDGRVRDLVATQKPAPRGRHFLVIKKNGDGRPCSFGKSSEFADAVQVADEQWDAHGEVDDVTGKRTGCCYPGETVGEYEVHLVSDKPLSEQL